METITHPKVPVSAPAPVYPCDAMPMAGTGARLFVWGVWALTLGALLAYVAEYSHNVPWSDDFAFLTEMLAPSLSLKWLLEPFNNHFVPIPRLIIYVLGKLTNYNFQAGMYISLLALGALAASLIWTAQSIRGYPRYTDAIFPLAILSFGHMENFLQNWGAIVYTVVVVLAGLMLVVVARCQGRPTLGQAMVGGVCAVLLPLSGGQGLAFVPPLLLWLGAVSVSWWRSGLPGGRRNGLVIGSLVLLAVLTFPLAFYSLSQDPGLPTHPSLPDVLWGIFQQLSLMFGSGVMAKSSYWPNSQVEVPLSLMFLSGVMAKWQFEVGVLADIILVLGLTFLVWRYLRQPGERFRSAGLVLVLGGLGAIALATAIGRVNNALAMRYAIFMVLVPCTLYFIGVIQDRSANGPLWQSGLFVLFCLLFSDSAQLGLHVGEFFHEGLSNVENDVRRGVPVEIVGHRHFVQWLGMTEVPAEQLDDGMELHIKILRQLRDNRSGIFVDLQDMPTDYQDLPVAIEPSALNEVVYQDGIAYGRGVNSYLSYTLEQPRMVYAIRLKGTVYHIETTPEKFMVSWGEKAGEAPENQEILRVRGKLPWSEQPSQEDFVVEAWVNDTIDSFHIRPDEKPSMIQISEVTLLVPPGS